MIEAQDCLHGMPAFLCRNCGPEQFLNGKVRLYGGDNREVIKGLEDNSIDSIVTDPPYALVSIVKRFGANGAAPVKVPEGGSGAYARASFGFMGKTWDTGDTAHAVEFWAECLRVLKPGGHLVAFSGTRTYHRMACAIEDAGFEIRDQIGWTYGSGFPKSHNIGDGWGTALKPAWEPIVLARKAVEGTIAANVLKHGTGAINIDDCRVAAPEGLTSGGNKTSSPLHMDRDAEINRISVRSEGHDSGRWPANIIHDGSEEVLAAFPDQKSPANYDRSAPVGYGDGNIYGQGGERLEQFGFGDSGSAARFFYTAKADADDRIGSKHPTVKPVDLMQWLVRLVTPKGGTVLDPFAGTGTTAEAAFREGMRCVLIEREAEYQGDIRRRMALCMAGPDERSRESIKAKLKDKPVDAGPLFEILR